MLALWISHGIIIALFLVLGIVFSRGKGAFLIAGYNTASKAEKSRMDETLLCRFMGKLMFSLAGCWVIVTLGGALESVLLHVLGLVLFFVLVIGAVVYANTGNRFQK